jgi:hypothetical protein
MTEPLPSSASSVLVSQPVGQPGRRHNVVSIAPFLDKSRFQKADDEGLYEPVYLSKLRTLRYRWSEPLTDMPRFTLEHFTISLKR